MKASVILSEPAEAGELKAPYAVQRRQKELER